MPVVCFMCVFLIFCTLCTIYIINNNNNNNRQSYCLEWFVFDLADVAIDLAMARILLPL